MEHEIEDRDAAAPCTMYIADADADADERPVSALSVVGASTMTLQKNP